MLGLLPPIFDTTTPTLLSPAQFHFLLPTPEGRRYFLSGLSSLATATTHYGGLWKEMSSHNHAPEPHLPPCAQSFNSDMSPAAPEPWCGGLMGVSVLGVEATVYLGLH